METFRSVLKFEEASESPGEHDKSQIAVCSTQESYARVSDSVGMG